MSKTYVLGMFPYPSGEGLHVGHVRIFTACDVMARYFRMKSEIADPSTSSGLVKEPIGENNVSYPLGSLRALGFPTTPSVLSPMGWDAFGLPAENAAIKNKTIPQKIVPRNYANFKKQMQNLSLSFDWDREFATTDPEYYAITQWIFLQIYNKGLVYREKVAINWCPKCLTGLANEEVLGDGTHERCGTVVTKKLLPQWVMKITEYAERLLTDLDKENLDWPKGILEMQRNWIGKGVGLSIDFPVEQIKQVATVWTKFWETIYGVTFIVIAPEVAKKWIESGWEANKGVVAYVEKSLLKSEQNRLAEAGEKTGVDTGLTAVNPVNGEKIPVWIADYVLANVGTGMVMGVPSHDERDFAFAKKFGLKLKQVVKYSDESIDRNVSEGKKSYEGEGTLINSGEFDGMSAWGEGKKKMQEWLISQGFAKEQTTYHLRDWVFSRQRYWGEPIPLVYCDKCGIVPVPESQLPLELPTLESYEPTETGESPLSRVTDWVNTTCPNCGGAATRETDTMPNWAGSCWYFLAFAFWRGANTKSEIRNLKQIRNQKSETKTPYTDWWKKVAKPEIDKWLPVDWYLGGAEHAVLHLLYARFWVKVLQDLGLVDFPEPFLRLRSVGLVLAEDGKKMSKSLGNVVNPDDMVAKYGSDAVRMYEMFMGPWDQSIAWDSGAISGQVRFLGRIKETVKNSRKVVMDGNSSPLLASKLKTLVERVESAVLSQKFNTAIAGLMEFVNAWRADGMVLSKEHVEMFASLLSLFAPETAKEISISHTGSVIWPDVKSFDSLALAQDLRVKIAVQVNGKLRGVVEVERGDMGDESRIVSRALEDEKVKKWVPSASSGQGLKKVIFVPGKLVNLVV